MRMRGQVQRQKRVSAGSADVGARLDAPWGPGAQVDICSHCGRREQWPYAEVKSEVGYNREGRKKGWGKSWPVRCAAAG